MKTRLWLSVMALGLVFVLAKPLAAADDDKAQPQKTSIEAALDKIVQLGPGVQAIKKDDKGRIISCVVVGQARISTVLGKERGLQTAREKASLDASAEFVKWLKEGGVTVRHTSSEDSVVLTEGTEGNGKDSHPESGKAVDKDSNTMESISKGLVRGLQIIHKDVDGEGKTYTIVKGWKADTADGVKKISADLASDETDSKEAKSGKSDSSSPEKTIKSHKATSDDAGDFVK